MINSKKKLLIIAFISMVYFPATYAQTIPITVSSHMSQVIFDGKWSFTQEWKESSLTEIEGSYGPIYIRTAHWDNFIYVMIDDVEKNLISKGSDHAIVCFDSKNDKSEIPDSNDYCFEDILDSNHAFSFQGGSSLGITGYFSKISIPLGFKGNSTLSDQHDRYSSIPHPSYEFKIPIELLGRSNVYGFFVSVYDSNNNKYYSWPTVQGQQNILEIPSPKYWGTIISPDKSLPEFSIPALIISVSITSVVLITKLFSRRLLKIS